MAADIPFWPAGLPPLPAPPQNHDIRWLQMARQYAIQSTDPIVRTGCVAVRGDRLLIGSSDHIANGVRDTIARRRNSLTRPAMLLSAEQAVIADAAANGISLCGSTFYVWPLLSSAAAVAQLIHANCMAVITPDFTVPSRMEDDYQLIREMTSESGVLLRAVAMPLGDHPELE